MCQPRTKPQQTGEAGSDSSCFTLCGQPGTPSPRVPCRAAAAKSLQSCPTLCDPIDGSPPGSCPWDSPGKKTGVGCHFLLQCMKVKSESEVAQSCLTLHGPMDCSLPGSSVHGIFQARVLEWVTSAFLRNLNSLIFFKPQNNGKAKNT